MKNTAQTYTVQPAAYVVIAHAINMNADAFVAGQIDQATWKLNQDALWAEAARKAIASDVMRIICPSVLEKREKREKKGKS